MGNERVIKQDGKTYRQDWKGDWIADTDIFGRDKVETDIFGIPKIETDAFGYQVIEADSFGFPIIPPDSSKRRSAELPVDPAPPPDQGEGGGGAGGALGGLVPSVTPGDVGEVAGGGCLLVLGLLLFGAWYFFGAGVNPPPPSTNGREEKETGSPPLLTGIYALFPANNPSGGPTARMSISSRQGREFTVGIAKPTGNPKYDWEGRGVIDGDEGYYDWVFEDGKRGRTTIRIDSAGQLRGQVRGAGIDWDYIGWHEQSPAIFLDSFRIYRDSEPAVEAPPVGPAAGVVDAAPNAPLQDPKSLSNDSPQARQVVPAAASVESLLRLKTAHWPCTSEPQLLKIRDGSGYGHIMKRAYSQGLFVQFPFPEGDPRGGTVRAWGQWHRGAVHRIIYIVR